MMEGYEHQIQHAIGQYLKASDDLEMAPMVGNFVVIAETVDKTGEVRMASIKADQLPLWTEAGMLTLRLDALRSMFSSWSVMNGLFEGHDHDDEDEGYGQEGY